MILFLALTACTGSSTDDDTAPATTDTDTTADTDTDTEPVPVWTQWPVGSSSTLNGVYASGEGVYVVGTDAGAYDGGASVDWVPVETGLDDAEDFTGLWGQGASDTLSLVACATSGNIARFSGGAWTVDDTGTANHEGIGGSGPEALYAVSWGGVYTWDGTQWAFEPLSGNERLNDVWGVGGDAFAVGEGGAIVRRDAADGWTSMTSGVTVDLNGVAGSALNDVWAVGAEGTALHFDGSTWTAVPTGVTEALWAVFAPGATSVYAVGNNGTAIYWNGTEWTSLPTGVANNLYAVHGVSAVNVWAVGNRGMAIQYKAN